jgi:hypothetical protein
MRARLTAVLVPLIAGSLFFLYGALCGGAIALAEPPSQEPVVLSHGTKVLLTRVRDYYEPGIDARGSGEVVEVVAFEALQQRGLSVVRGEHAAQLNVQDDARRAGVEYVVRPVIERLRLSPGRDAELTLAIDLLGPEVGDPIARCEVEHAIDRDELQGKGEAREIAGPAVKSCLDQLLEVTEPPEPSEETSPALEGLPPLTAPRYALRPAGAPWLFVGAGKPGYPPAFWSGPPSEIVRRMLVRSDVEVCGEEETDCPRVLALGVGSLRKGLEPPPPAAPVHVVAVVTDAESGEVVKGALAEASRTLWMEGDETTLEAMLQQAAERATGRRIERLGPTPRESFEVFAFEPPAWVDRPQWVRPAEDGGAPGHVRVGLVVGEDGTVQDAQPVGAAQGLKKGRLAELTAGWRFEPARRDGEPIPLYLEVLVPRERLGL